MNTCTGPIQKYLQGVLARMKMVQFGIALNLAAHDILKKQNKSLKKNYGI